MECFVALGGNFENSRAAIRRALDLLSLCVGLKNLKSSRIFRTDPVSEIVQPDFLNAVCRFTCTLSPHELWNTLIAIETKIGKLPKQKNAPRMIDLDLLFYGNLYFHSESLTIPHPHWHTRPFVLIPLAELVQEHSYPSPIQVKKLVDHFSNKKEKVVLFKEHSSF